MNIYNIHSDIKPLKIKYSNRVITQPSLLRKYITLSTVKIMGLYMIHSGLFI